MEASTTSTIEGVEQDESSTLAEDARESQHEEESDDDRRRRLALEQADAVLEALGGEYYLDGFNLLGVIANPRGISMMSPTTATTSTSYHGRYSSSLISGASAHGGSSTHSTATEAVSDSYYHSLETTLTQITEQMEAFNHMLEDWSRQILEDDTYLHSSGSEELPESQLKELPEALQSLDLHKLQNYLEKTGVVAHSFTQILQQHAQEQQILGSTTDNNNLNNRRGEPNNVAGVLPEIPDIFFREDFDLTDPKTFSELLIASSEDDGDDDDNTNHVSATAGDNNKETDSDDRPIAELFPLLPPDAFGGFLDKAELELLQQVRSKSSDFFAESVRFAQLQEWIQGLLAQVMVLQETTTLLKQDLLDPMEVVPIADQQRRDLRKLLVLLDRADDMLQCKSSLAGILSAQDDLMAIEQINYGRKLLAGTAVREKNDQAEAPEEEEEEIDIELGRLQSLKSVAEQLNQYEQLVVNKLRDELVEIFLGWNSAAVSSVYALNGSAGGGSSSGAKSSQHVRDRVREIMGALKSCHALGKTREAYSHRLQDMIRLTVRTTVAEFSTDGHGTAAAPTVSSGTTTMSLARFLDCLDLLFEQLLGLLNSASGVDEFCVNEGFSFEKVHGDENDRKDSKPESAEGASDAGATTVSASPMSAVIASAAELSSKSVSELLRLRKEAHSLVTLDEMKSIWDACLQFTITVEKLSGRSSTLRSTLLAQAKAFVERKHESNMSALVAALDSERWTQCEVSAERQDALTRLCSGRSLISVSLQRKPTGGVNEVARSPDAEVEGTRYKVVWSCLLLVEMISTNVQAAAHFSSLSSGVVGKVAELLRLFNSRTTHLVLGAGAIHSNAKLKSINAKHLSLVTQCLGLIISILPHVRAALMAQMPKKQHTLLNDLDQIRREFGDHNEKVLNKFVTIIGGIVEHGLAPKIAGADFDARASSAPAGAQVSCCVFLEGVAVNTKKMHQVLRSLLPPDHLRDVFSRIFAFVDTKVPALLISASEKADFNFSFPSTEAGKKRLLAEMELMIGALNGLEGVLPWDFTAVPVLERRLEVEFYEKEEGVSHDATPLPTGDKLTGNAATFDSTNSNTDEEPERSSPNGVQKGEKPVLNVHKEEGDLDSGERNVAEEPEDHDAAVDPDTIEAPRADNAENDVSDKNIDKGSGISVDEEEEQNDMVSADEYDDSKAEAANGPTVSLQESTTDMPSN